MSNDIKKVFQPLVTLLENNKEAKVKDLLEQIYDMSTSKQISSASKVDSKGNVTHIYCYYHKKWEDISKVEYGKKASSKTGLNTMCKEGVSNWTKQQREYKKAQQNMLSDIAKGLIAPTEVDEKLLELEVERDKIIPREDGLGSDEV